MTPTHQFIEDAIAGGWRHAISQDNMVPRISTYAMRSPILRYEGINPVSNEKEVLTRGIPTEEILLDPLAWQAVGKTRGWKGQKEMTAGFLKATFEVWQDKQLTFTVYLQQGKTIDDALAAIK